MLLLQAVCGGVSGNRLSIRGYAGIPLFGRTTSWTRENEAIKLDIMAACMTPRMVSESQPGLHLNSRCRTCVSAQFAASGSGVHLSFERIMEKGVEEKGGMNATCCAKHTAIPQSAGRAGNRLSNHAAIPGGVKLRPMLGHGRPRNFPPARPDRRRSFHIKHFEIQFPAVRWSPSQFTLLTSTYFTPSTAAPSSKVASRRPGPAGRPAGPGRRR